MLRGCKRQCSLSHIFLNIYVNEMITKRHSLVPQKRDHTLGLLVERAAVLLFNGDLAPSAFPLRQK